MKYTLTLPLLASLALAVPVPDPQRGGGGDRAAGTRGGSAAVAQTTAAAVASSQVADAAASAPASTQDDAAAAATSAGGTSSNASSSTNDSASDTNASSSSDTESESGSGSSGSDSSSSSSSSSSSGSGSAGGHDITVINNCPSGQVRWKHGDGSTDVQTISGTVHVDGDVTAARMWLDDFDGISCGEADGLGCALIEFTLKDGFSSINYSLLGAGLGDHEIHAPMTFALKGDNCDAEPPGICYGMKAEECKSGYTGTDTGSGKPPTCPADSTNVDAIMTFCPDG